MARRASTFSLNKWICFLVYQNNVLTLTGSPIFVCWWPLMMIINWKKRGCLPIVNGLGQLKDFDSVAGFRGTFIQTYYKEYTKKSILKTSVDFCNITGLWGLKLPNSVKVSKLVVSKKKIKKSCWFIPNVVKKLHICVQSCKNAMR